MIGSNLSQSVWHHCRIDTLALDDKADKINRTDTATATPLSSLKQLTFAHCTLGLDITMLATRHDWHIYNNTPPYLAGNPAKILTDLITLPFLEKGHKGRVTSVAFSPDGGTIFSAGSDGLFSWKRSEVGEYQLQQYWTSAFCLQFEQGEITQIMGNSTAWQQANFSDGKQTLALDAFSGFTLRL